MFEGFSSGLLPGWVAPSLEVAEVAEQVAGIVLGGESEVSRWVSFTASRREAD